MKLTKTLHMAISSILSNKVRSFLTMLGVIIGIMAVIALVSIMGGVAREITDLFEELGTDSINITILERGGNRGVKAKDMYSFLEENKQHFTYLSPLVMINGASVKAQGVTDAITTTAVQGVSEEYDEIKNQVIEQGRSIQFMDVEAEAKVCVIGTYLEQKLFGKGKALGQSVKLNGVSYTVVGVLEEMAESDESSSDDCLFLPYTSASKLSKNAVISSYVITVADLEKVALSKTILEQKLDELVGEDFYDIMVMSEMMDQMNMMLNTMTLSIVAIAGISLLVGGIGIMNIMLVSVTERTREIGIRKSLGAKNRNILQQFVIEAATVSGIGGVLGIGAGFLLSYGAGKLLKLTVIPSLESILVAFSVSVGIGITFGYLPARKAAKLNPIDALRYE